jgi:uncharacterized delta-60 repeat protein
MMSTRIAALALRSLPILAFAALSSTTAALMSGPSVPSLAAERVFIESTDPVPSEPIIQTDPVVLLVEPSHGGTLDTSFGTAGIVKVTWPPGTRFGGMWSMVVQPDGRILVSGGSSLGVTMLRFLEDGTFDPSFGTGGLATFDPLGDMGGGGAMARVRPDGRIIAAGAMAGYLRSVARFHFDGSIDTTFGTGGYVAWGAAGTTTFRALAIQPDGKILAGSESSQAFYVVRLLEDGGLDPGFGSGGVVTTAFPDLRQAGVASLLVQPDGRIIAAGGGIDSEGGGVATVARYEPDGSLDQSFGDAGTLFTDALYGAWWAGQQSDGMIVLAGESPSREDMGVVRVYPDGSPDPAFGDRGIGLVDFGKDTSRVETGLLQMDDKIVVGGPAYYYSAKPGQPAGGAFGIARFEPDGRLDRAFGKGGIVAMSLGYSRIRALAQQTDGHILAAGESGDAAGSWFVARFRPENSGAR